MGFWPTFCSAYAVGEHRIWFLTFSPRNLCLLLPILTRKSAPTSTKTTRLALVATVLQLWCCCYCCCCWVANLLSGAIVSLSTSSLVVFVYNSPELKPVPRCSCRNYETGNELKPRVDSHRASVSGTKDDFPSGTRNRPTNTLPTLVAVVALLVVATAASAALLCVCCCVCLCVCVGRVVICSSTLAPTPP